LPESLDIIGRPHEPDTDNAGVGKGNRPYPSGMRFLFFLRLTVNGEILEKTNARTVMELLNELQIGPGHVAVEVNLSIVKKADYSTFRLKDGDKVEILNFIGGR
jgi:sulfur carrier protein